jgi:[CysO sulfur-carrier protein]-S-L-cysteine hydrolase
MDGVHRLIISGELRRQILSHARGSRPQEAVGLLGGTREGWVRRALPLPNLAGGDKRFIADPFAQFCALRRLKSEHLELLAIYHSHPGGGVEPSQEDLEYAKQWSCAHLIVSCGVRGEHYDRVRAFRCVNGSSMERAEVPIILT